MKRVSENGNRYFKLKFILRSVVGCVFWANVYNRRLYVHYLSVRQLQVYCTAVNNMYSFFFLFLYGYTVRGNLHFDIQIFYNVSLASYLLGASFSCN